GPQGWSWGTAAIEGAGIPQDLLTMMTAKLARLGPRQRELLLTAAVIGTHFELSTLEALVGTKVLAEALVPLIDEGLIAPLGGGRHGFTHDRIREVAYHMVPLERRVELHRAIGELRLARVGMGELAENVFEVVDHIDLGYGLIPLPDEDQAAATARCEEALAGLSNDERDGIAELNSLAGVKALTGSSVAAAGRYLAAGVRLIAGDRPFPRPRETNHTLRFALELGL
ncbi:MAG: hypothetical protein KC431_15755, partial [Myxococcales bacterium]|nr:hypothetical protein [Myxococcales bacterium]